MLLRGFRVGMEPFFKRIRYPIFWVFPKTSEYFEDMFIRPFFFYRTFFVIIDNCYFL